MQRGVGNVNPMKMAKCIVELEKIYGIRQGSAGKVSLERNNFAPKTQEDLASEIGVSMSQLHRYKELLNLVPDIQDLIECKINA